MRRFLFVLAWVFVLLTACQAGSSQQETVTEPDNQVTATPDLSLTPLPTETATHTPTPTQPVLMLVLPDEMDEQLAVEFQSVFEAHAAEAGLELVVVESLDPAVLGEEVKGLVIFSQDDALNQLSQVPAGTRVLVLGTVEQPLGDGVLVIDGSSASLDQAAFLAGYTSAVITTDWRIGLILTGASSPEEAAVEQAFRNGVIFYCGLCRPAYPPYIAYPAVIIVTPDSGDGGIQSAVDQLRTAGIVTVYLPPMIQDAGLMQALASAGINMIGSGQSEVGVEANWIASIQPDLLAAVQSLGSGWLSGGTASPQTIPVSIANPNPELFSTGRQHLVEKLQEDLRDGFHRYRCSPVRLIIQ